MEDVNLFNATVIGENPDAAFIAEGNKLHATDQEVALFRKDKSNPELIFPLMRDALKALAIFSEGKVTNHFLTLDFNKIPKNNTAELMVYIQNIYNHLPHHERNKLSSLVHHAHH